MVVKKAAIENEISLKDKEIIFTFREVEFVIPPPKTWDKEIVRAQENGKLLSVVEGLVGKKQLKTFDKLVKTMGDIEDFIVVMYDAIDADPKE